MAPGEQDRHVAAVRRFSRFYTRRIGLLHEGLLGGPLSLSEGRLVYELATRGRAISSALAEDLGLDSGYMSRLVRGLEARGLVQKSPSSEDGRQIVLSLSAQGRGAFAEMDARSQREISGLLGPLSAPQRGRLADSLLQAERLLGGADEVSRAPLVLRPPRAGDMGWVIHRQAALYAEEYAWTAEFEALVAEIVAAFIRNFDPDRERCWMAERDGAVIGSVFLVKASETEAKLRLLYVEPEARGHGVGARLIEECIRSARQFGYRRLTLWTNDILVAARRLYQAAGFRLVSEEPHHSFGHDLVGQNWALEL